MSTGLFFKVQLEIQNPYCAVITGTKTRLSGREKICAEYRKDENGKNLAPVYRGRHAIFLLRYLSPYDRLHFNRFRSDFRNYSSRPTV